MPRLALSFLLLLACALAPDAAVAQVARSCEGLDGIVNFAGILEVGSVIEVDPETIRHVLDVNVMGTVRVNHALFPLLLALPRMPSKPNRS